MNKKYYKLFTNCIIVKGKNRATIVDLQRNNFNFIPLSLCSLFDEDNLIDFESIKTQLDKESIPILNEYIEFLEEKEYIFECTKEESKLFPPLSINYEYPSIISNVIIDYDKNSNHDFQKILNEFLVPVNCRHIQVRCYDMFDLDFIDSVVKIINDSFIKSVEFIIKYDTEISIEDLKEWVSENKKIKSVALHSFNKNKIIQEQDYGFGTIVGIKQEINNNIHCGVIHHNYFNTSIESFTESQHHNSCLNKKIAIDKDGNIKNCPAISQSFGNIKNTTLEEALQHKDFKKYWNITKDQIDICKDCEFRHICTDCRAYIEDPENQYSKPLKCGYDPYTNQWEEWSTNPLKQKAIQYYGMQELISKTD
ncbi:grasp-with-spasm system SPASM domain peptide maturase [Flavobacterium sediminilitoris]|uniref:Grasp-with-spasm system SPASM domain peptide maturase n=1 Tax=Flavobacterium sediminilitoris TaxID=2024526 RepID=A0ABY4HNP9_9FLAO|nr:MULTISPECIES: grasp-with-spasm system SPASM domain peptide maturase [Flavobacterium]UOX34308.1 grasp-with-spasm system SPASM domain peptide maturase [Flavobacterium sediminilitoris]